jgi:hypothetical protein
MDGTHPFDPTEVTTDELAHTIGAEYVNCSFQSEQSELTQESYRNIARINGGKFASLMSEVDVVFTEDDPYASYQDMKEKVEETDTLKVFSGGTHPDPRFMTETENVIGRAVHDYYGHLSADVNFSFEGEFRKWQHVKDDYFPRDREVLFAEVVGQLSAAKFLDGGFADPRFEQREIRAPQRWIDWTKEHIAAKE